MFVDVACGGLTLFNSQRINLARMLRDVQRSNPGKYRLRYRKRDDAYWPDLELVDRKANKVIQRVHSYAHPIGIRHLMVVEEGVTA